MDAVELNFPVDVTKLMGSEGFVRGARVTEDYKPLLNSSIDCCTASVRDKDETGVVSALESGSWSKIPDAELCRHASQLPSSQAEVSEQHDYRGSTCHVPSTGPDVVNAQRKAVKIPRSTSGCSKRARISQPEDTTNSIGVDDVKDITDNLGSCSTRYNFPDKTQTPRQRNSFIGKRGDRRSFKVAMKSKFESFSMKAGLAGFSVASGGNNFLGLYGLKSDIHDVTKLMKDLSLDELLDGTYECPSLGRGKGRKAANSTENFLHSVRKACSILPHQRVESYNFTDVDNSPQKKMLINPVSSVSSSCINGDKEDACSTDPSPCNKAQDSCGKFEIPANPPDSHLWQPKDILERLALPPAKDLDSLLLDATKTSSSTRNNSDTRSGKQIPRRASLPPFPWSHTFNGHCRTNSDAVKLLSNKSTCQGRWVKIPYTSSLPGLATGCFTDLESLAYDPSVIPSVSNVGNSEGGIALSTDNLRFREQGSSSLATYSMAFNVPDVGHCPRLLAAAQTLCDIATKSSRQNPDGIVRWPKKPSQKAMKARKTKSFEKPEEIFAAPSSVLGSDKLKRSDVDQMIPSKKAKHSVVENKKDLNHINGIRKGPIAWSTPRSSRSSPGKSVRDSIVEIRQSTANVIKPPCTTHPQATVSDKPCNSQHKLRKLMPLEWRRGR